MLNSIIVGCILLILSFLAIFGAVASLYIRGYRQAVKYFVAELVIYSRFAMSFKIYST